jgi:hypothetical protein
VKKWQDELPQVARLVGSVVTADVADLLKRIE